jgi:hypothetical protein
MNKKGIGEKDAMAFLTVKLTITAQGLQLASCVAVR